MNFVFYDLETTGRNSTWDQIIQVGAILVDEKFNEIERFEERCRLRPGVVPEPGALIVNNTSGLQGFVIRAKRSSLDKRYKVIEINLAIIETA